MKKLLLPVLVCGMFASTFAQSEVSDKWVITPVPNMKGVLGRLDINFPPDVERNILIYQQTDNKFLRSVSHNDKIYTIAPGQYRFTLTNVPVDNVPIQKGHETRLKAGFLNIVSDGDWHLYNDTKEKAYTSGNKPKKLPLPVGSYQVKLGGQFYPLIIKDGETVEDYSPVEVINDVQIKPEVLIDDQYQYIMSLIPTSDTVLTTMGRFTFGLNASDFMGTLGNSYEFRVAIYDETGNMVNSCGVMDPCSQHIYLPEGKYSVAIRWSHDYGQIVGHSPIRIFNILIKKGSVTRVKVGYFRHETNGDFELLNETKELSYWSYSSRVSLKRLLPVGRYIVRQPGIGEFPIQIEDKKIESLNSLPPGGFNKKLEAPAFRISPIVAKDLKPGMGRLNCDFPLADTVCCYRLLIPDANGNPTSINLLTMKSIDLLPGKYELSMAGLVLPFQIEKQKETKIICGYMVLPSRKTFCDALRGGCALYISYKTIPIRPGYYYIHDAKDNPGRSILIRVREGEITDYNQSILVTY
jgi:hypothetical protein